MPEHFTVQEPAPDAVEASSVESPVQEPSKDVIVAQVTDDVELLAQEAQAPTPAELLEVAQGADGGMIGVVLALVAVLGGGAAWRFYSQHSKQKAALAEKQAEQAHELAMRRLDVEAQAATASPPPCLAAHAQLEARIAACEAKISSASLTLPAGFDADELSERIERLEKANKPKPAPRRKP